MAERYGGRYSPGGAKPGAPPPAAPFGGRRARRVSMRARLMFLLPLPLLFAGIGAISRKAAPSRGIRAVNYFSGGALVLVAIGLALMKT